MARIEAVDEKPHKKAKKQQSAVLKLYLITYNVLSALGWSYVAYATLSHVFGSPTSSHVQILSDYLPSLFPPQVTTLGWVDHPVNQPSWAVYLEKSVIPREWFPEWRRAATTGVNIGQITTTVQAFAILEVVHSLLGFVRSPFVTVLMQVASRYYAVFGINYLFPQTLENPLYTSMVLSWSITEVIRYTFYALNLVGLEPYPLLWLRYTTFWLLYPTGAASEAFLIFSTLPDLKKTPLVDWSGHDWFRLTMFFGWWPALYVLYTHMIKQRRKIIGGGSAKLKSKTQ